MRTFLVAVAAETHKDVQDFLKASTLGPRSDHDIIDCWWVAEDDREDGSDNDSAIFIPRGAQEDMYSLISQYFDAHKEEWDEEGYPYADTDVSGAFYLPREQRWPGLVKIPKPKNPRRDFSWISLRRKPCEIITAQFYHGPQFCSTLTYRRFRIDGNVQVICKEHQ